MAIEKAVLSVSEAAFVLGCSEQKIYRLIRANALGAYKDVGGRPWHIPDYCVRDYIDSCMKIRTFAK